jgi:hypothetical protein
MMDCTASLGGGLYSERAQPKLRHCRFLANEASFRRGNLYCWLSDVVVCSSIFVGDPTRQDRAIYAFDGNNVTVCNCTFVNHTAVPGRTIVCDVAIGGTPNFVELFNCILWNGGREIYNDGGDSVILVEHSDVFGGRLGEGNIDADPWFVDPDGPDDDPTTWQDNDYHLLGGSPCIDAGDNVAVTAGVTTDLDWLPRFVDDPGMPDDGVGTPPIVDMGAYEFQGETCFADLDGDGYVGLEDLATLLSNYRASDGVVYTDGDLDRDEDVDLSDLSALLAVYRTTCE